MLGEDDLVLTSLIFVIITISSFVYFIIIYYRSTKLNEIDFHLIILINLGIILCCLVTLPSLLGYYSEGNLRKIIKKNTDFHISNSLC